MSEAVVGVAHSEEEGEDQKLEVYQEGMQHTKVCHVQREECQFLLDKRAPIWPKCVDMHH